MSIIIATVDKREAVLATDTLGRSRIDPDFRAEVSKSFAVPHLRLAFGVMGPQAFAAHFLVYIASLEFGGCDAILDNLAEHAGRVLNMGMEDDEPAPLALIAAVGWSAEANRPRGAYAMNFVSGPETNGSSMTASDTTEFRSAPLIDASYHAPMIDPAAQERIARNRRLDRRGLVVEAAKEQRKTYERGRGPGWMGGRVIMHTITRNEMTCRTVHEWPEDLIRPEEAAKPAEAPNVVRLGLSKVAA
jgi:hypothetical protein